MIFTLAGDLLRHAFSPCVYTVFRDDIPIYIGVTKNGLGRVFSVPKGEQPNRDEAIKLSTSIEIRTFPDRDEASRFESWRIHIWHPEFNQLCSECGMSTSPLANRPYIPYTSTDWAQCRAEEHRYGSFYGL